MIPAQTRFRVCRETKPLSTCQDPAQTKKKSTMSRAKRTRIRKSAKIHDRRAQDLPLNAQVAAVEIDDPLALEPGEKIVAMRSIRNDPLGRLHSHHQIDEAQYRGGRAFQ